MCVGGAHSTWKSLLVQDAARFPEGSGAPPEPTPAGVHPVPGELLAGGERPWKGRWAQRTLGDKPLNSPDTEEVHSAWRVRVQDRPCLGAAPWALRLIGPTLAPMTEVRPPS